MNFIKARIIRIYPVYIMCALITTLIGLIFSQFDYNQVIIFVKSITLFRDWLGGPAVDGVLWTLEVEIKFYIYMALMLPLLRKKPVVVIVVPLIIILLLIFIVKISPVYPISSFLRSLANSLNVLLYDFGYLSYMNIGLIIYLYHTNRFNKVQVILLVGLSLFISLIFLNARYQGNNMVLTIYFFAFFVFLFFYRFGAYFKLGFSGFFARISYPLYAVHSTLGYALLSVLIFKYNIRPLIALVFVICFVVIIAYLIHKFIELPSIKKGSAFA